MDQIRKSYSLVLAYKAAVFIVIIMLFFLKGGYYYSEIIPSITIIFICGAFVFAEDILHSGIKKMFKSLPDTFRENNSYGMIMLLMCGLVCAYSISLIQAYDLEATLHEVIKYGSLIVFTYIISRLFQTYFEKKSLLILIYVIAGISAVCALSVIGNGHVDQWLNALASFFLRIPTALVALVEGDYVEGFMQYANAYASYLGACFYIGLFLIVNEERRFVKAIYLCIQVVICLVFILTKSRGANLIWGGVSIVAIVVAKAHRKRLIYYFAFVAANVALVYYTANITASYGGGIISTNLWIWLLGSAVLIFVLTCTFLPRYIKKLLTRNRSWCNTRTKQILITTVIVFFACSALFIIVKTILVLDDKSTYNRLLYVGASYEIFKDHYLMGAGGNAWQILYPNYLSFEGLILTRFTHGYLLQLAIECGVMGIAVFVSMVFTQIKLFIKSLRVYTSTVDTGSILLFIAGAGLFVHAIIDFDFTYYYILLLWIMLMLFGSSANSKQINDSHEM